MIDSLVCQAVGDSVLQESIGAGQTRFQRGHLACLKTCIVEISFSDIKSLFESVNLCLLGLIVLIC